MFIIRKQFKFEMAHQLWDSYSAACHENLHGHSYILELFVQSETLDDTGMVVDFGEIKDVVKEYIDQWDHSLTMPNMFPKEYLDMLAKFTKRFRITEYNPTAENMAKDIFKTLTKKLNDYQTQEFGNIRWKIAKIRLHETTTGWAEYFE